MHGAVELQRLRSASIGLLDEGAQAEDATDDGSVAENLEGGEDAHLSGTCSTIINTFLGFFGAAILSTPYAFKCGGLLLSSITLLAVSSGCVYCMWLLTVCKRNLASARAESYSDVCKQALGMPGLILVESALVVTQTSFSIAYIVFIAKNLRQLYGVHTDPVVLACVPLLILLCLLRHLKYLAPFSLLAEVMNIVGIAVVFATDVQFMEVSHVEIELVNWRALPFTTGLFLYCFEAIGMILPLQASAKNKEQFTPILCGVIGVYASMCAAMGTMGYLAYGAATQDIILLNMVGNTYVSVVKITFCIGLFFTFPIMMVPVWEILEQRALHKGASRIQRHALRAAVVCGAAFIAAKVPSFSSFMSLVGSSCCALLAFILPPIAHDALLRRSGGTQHWCRHALHAVLVTVGIVTAVTGTADAVRSMTQDHHANAANTP